jgi:hypothetical protein
MSDSNIHSTPDQSIQNTIQSPGSISMVNASFSIRNSSVVSPEKLPIPTILHRDVLVPSCEIATKSDYIAAIIMFFIGGILYYTLIYSKLFQPIRDYFVKWKTQLLVNTFIRDNTIQNTSDQHYIREVLSAF